MYRLNPLPRKTLIVTDEVVAQADIDKDHGISNLLKAIDIAERRFIEPALGTALYDDFRDKKNVLVSSLNISALQAIINASLINSTEPHVLAVGDVINSIELVAPEWYRKLWYEHLWKLTAEAVAMIATPTNWIRHTAQGMMQNNPKVPGQLSDGKGASSADRKDIEWYQDNLMMNRIDPLISSMQAWLRFNYLNFSLYDYTPEICGCDGEITTKRKTGWINVYGKRNLYGSY